MIGGASLTATDGAHALVIGDTVTIQLAGHAGPA